jgi:hypothetical protein
MCDAGQNVIEPNIYTGDKAAWVFGFNGIYAKCLPRYTEPLSTHHAMSFKPPEAMCNLILHQGGQSRIHSSSKSLTESVCATLRLQISSGISSRKGA